MRILTHKLWHETWQVVFISLRHALPIICVFFLSPLVPPSSVSFKPLRRIRRFWGKQEHSSKWEYRSCCCVKLQLLSHAFALLLSTLSTSSFSEWIKENQFPYSLVLEELDYRGRRERRWAGGGGGTPVTQRAAERTSNENSILPHSCLVLKNVHLWKLMEFVICKSVFCFVIFTM